VSTETAGLRYASAIAWLTTALFFVIALAVAIVIPIHAQDALTFGEWSRLISENWNFHFAAATAQEYGRPLFYVLQGWMWGIFGFSEVSGRLLSGAFSLSLFGALVWLVRDRDWGALAAMLVAVALIATPTFAFHVVSGLTDVPVAALVALAGALVWGSRPSPARAATLAVVSALAMLAKPSALLALVGLAAAQLLINESWRSRLLFRVVPILAGLGAGLVYDLTQARYVHQDLRTFLQSGVNTDFYSTLAAEARRYAVLDGNWFGDGLRLAVFFAFLYVCFRIAGVSHRFAVFVALPFAVVASWFGPWLAADQDRIAVGALHSAGAAAAAAGTAIFLAFGAWSYNDAVASRTELARFAIWAVPSAVAWAVYGAYDARLLAPAWPPLLALIALTALPAASVFARRGPLALAVPFALFAVVVASNVYNIDGLRESGWDQLRRTDDRFDRDQTRAIVMPAFSRALVVVRKEMQRDDLLISPEGAFRFFFPGHVEQSFPIGCEQLQRFRVFVLLTDEGSKRYMKDFLHVSPEPSYWASCQSPRLTQLTDGSEGYAVFRVQA
jgi:hypothetical protein